MSDRIRQALAFVIAVGMIIAVASAPTLAQVAGSAIEPAALNADTVDGRHAVGPKASKAKRARKLVATDARGFLPSNIVKPKWSLIRNLPASFTDGRIGWYEVANKPAGFADNVDDRGVTGVKLTMVKTPDMQVPGGGTPLVIAWCPGGSMVTGGGFWTSSASNFIVHRNMPRANLLGWEVGGHNTGKSSLTINAYAVCLSTTPSGAISTARRSK